MNELLQQGVNIMLYGMGTVFLFLSLLVLVIMAMSSVIQRWLPEPVVEPVRKRSKAITPQPISAATLAILQAAVDRHRQPGS